MRYKFIGGSLGKGEKKPRKKIDMSEGQCDLEKIIMLILTLTGKKKEQKKKKDKNLLLTKKTKKKITKIVIYHIVAITATKQINILLSCLKIYAC